VVGARQTIESFGKTENLPEIGSKGEYNPEEGIGGEKGQKSIVAQRQGGVGPRQREEITAKGRMLVPFLAGETLQKESHDQAHKNMDASGTGSALHQRIDGGGCRGG